MNPIRFGSGLFILLAALLQASPTVYVCNVGGSDLTAINSATDAVLATSPVITGSSPRAFAVSLDQSKIYTVNFSSDTVSVIDTVSNMNLMDIPLGAMGGGPAAIAITPDGLRLYVACLSGNSVKVISTATNSVTDTIIGFNSPNNLVVLPNGNEVYVSNPVAPSGPSIKVIDNTLVNPVVTATVVNANIVGPNAMCVTPDSLQVYSAEGGGLFVNAISTLMAHTVTNIPVGNGPFCLAITHLGDRIYVPGANAMNLSVISTASNTVLSTIPIGDTPVWAAVTHDDTKVYVAIQNDNAVGVIDNSVIPPTMLSGPTIAVGVGPQFLAITPDDSKVFVSNTSAGNSVTSIHVGSGMVSTLAIPAGPMPNFIGFAEYIAPIPSISDVSGHQRKNKFFTQTELINVVTWTVPVSGGPFVSYSIYRDASLTDLAAEVPAGGLLEFNDHNRKKNEAYSYFIVGINQVGTATSVGMVTINPS